MNYYKKISHKGKTVMYSDYRGLSKPEQLKVLDEYEQILKMAPSSQLFLANFEGVSLGTEYMNRVKPIGKEYQSKIKHTALLGVTGLKKILLQGYNLFTGSNETKSFENETEALDWLVS